MRSARPHRTAGRMARHRVATGAFTISQWPKGGISWVRVMPTLRACRARPSQGWTTQEERPCEEGPDIARGEVFSEDALCASALQGRPHTEAFHCTRWVRGSPWAYDHMFRLCPALLTGVGSPPLHRPAFPEGQGLKV